jgi:hypothetical protein
MKKILITFLLAGCVSRSTPLDYAKRAHPECENHQVTAHRNEPESQSEVTMTCDGVTKTIAVKCIHGFGIVSDTTCHENN